MTCIQAILMDVAFVAFGLLMLGVASWDLIRNLRRKPQNVFIKNDRTRTPEESFGILLFCVLWSGGVTVGTLYKLSFYSDMSHLRPETVERIEIGAQAVTNRQQITEIVTAIEQAEWFSLRRGDAADETSFVIKLASGKQYNYKATRYQRGEGAALISQSPSGWYKGEVFCRRLPASLKQAGIVLPNCFTYFGEAQHCAPP